MKKIFLFTTFLCLSFLLFSQKNIEEKALDLRKESIEKQEQLLEKQYQLDVQALKNESQSFVLEVKNKLSALDAFAWLFGLGAVGFLFAMYQVILKQIERKAEEIAEKKIEERVAKILEINKTNIIQMIKENDSERTIKKEVKILVITQQQEDFKEIQNWLVVWRGFNGDNVHILATSEFKVQAGNYDVIIFNNGNTGGGIPRKELYESFMKHYATDNTMFFYYGFPNFIPDVETSLKDRLGFSNAQYSLESNLLGTIKLHPTFREIYFT